MHTKVSIRHETTSHRIDGFVQEELDRLGSKYDIMSAEVVIDQEGPTGSIKTAEFILKVKGEVIHAKESSEEIHKSIDLAVKRLDAQLAKYKDLHAKPTSLKRQSGQEIE